MGHKSHKNKRREAIPQGSPMTEEQLREKLARLQAASLMEDKPNWEIVVITRAIAKTKRKLGMK